MVGAATGESLGAAVVEQLVLRMDWQLWLWSNVGGDDGLVDGAILGDVVGAMVGGDEGELEGLIVGGTLGALVGFIVVCVGENVGADVGANVGDEGHVPWHVRSVYNSRKYIGP